MLKQYNTYGGNPLIQPITYLTQQPITYNVETILNDISSFKKDKSHFGKYCCNKMEKILRDKTKDATFYENNLCVFVEFSPFIDRHADRLYLGKMSSTYDKYTQYGESVENLYFQCDLLYSYKNDQEHFVQQMTYNTGDTHVIIGFLPIVDKEIVLQKAKKVRQL
jgi:hypothetical protein